MFSVGLQITGDQAELEWSFLPGLWQESLTVRKCENIEFGS